MKFKKLKTFVIPGGRGLCHGMIKHDVFCKKADVNITGLVRLLCNDKGWGWQWGKNVYFPFTFVGLFIIVPLLK